MEPGTLTLNGYSRTFSDQIDALTIAYKEALYQFPPELWTWGGGTVLSLYYFHHRKSFDIDIFILDPQVFAYLSPKWILDNDKTAFSGEYQETADHIQFVIAKSHINVDFILSPAIFPHRIQQNTLLDLGFDFYIESLEEIIIKKLKFRRKYNVARDIFDIAVAITERPNLLETLYNERALTIEALVEWDTALRTLDTERYQTELDMIAPSKDRLHIAMNAKEIIVEAIEKLRKIIIEHG